MPRWGTRGSYRGDAGPQAAGALVLRNSRVGVAAERRLSPRRRCMRQGGTYEKKKEARATMLALAEEWQPRGKQDEEKCLFLQLAAANQGG